MRAIIFAAGYGTRLKPWTDSHPKALVPVDGVPALERAIVRLREAGVTQVVVNVHHFAGQIVGFIENRDWGIPVYISDESDRLLDTGGGLLKARKWLDTGDGEPFIVHNADIVSDLDLDAMVNYHRQSGAAATLLAMDRSSSRHLYFSRMDKRLEGWGDDRDGSTRPEGFVPDASMLALAFGGIHVLSPEVFGFLEEYSRRIGDTAFPIVPFYTSVCKNMDIRAYNPDPDTYLWYDIGTMERVEQATEGLQQSHLMEKQHALDRRYLRMARIWAENSYCRRRQVGAIIVKDKMIISDGYNGTPAGFENVCEDEATARTKPYVLHAEANAITKVARSNNSSDNATLYVTASPCLECAKLIIQAGIKRVVFDELYRITDGIDLLRRAGVECRHMPLCPDNAFQD